MTCDPEAFFSQPFFANWREWIGANARRDVAANALSAWFACEERLMHAALEGYERKGGLDASLTVLDVGCGFGGHVVDLLRRHPQWRAIGIDGDGATIAAARACAKRRGVGSRVRFVVDEADRLNCCSRGEVDCAICMNTFGVFSEEVQGRFLRRIQQVVRPGGLLFMTAYSEEADAVRIASYEAIGLVVHKEGNRIVATAGLRSEAFSPPRLTELVERYGFELADDMVTVDEIGFAAAFHRLKR